MNKRAGTVAEYATGDSLRMLRTIEAGGSHAMLEGGVSHILIRKDVASRYTVFHEWLHRRLQRQLGSMRPGEERIIDDFLERHKELLKIDPSQY